MNSLIALSHNWLFGNFPSIFLAQDTNDYAARTGGGVTGIISLIIGLIVLVAFWKLFTKAGQPGWAAIIPIFNLYILCKIAGRPGWWVILMFIPLVNFIIWIVIAIDVAKKFGKGAGFGVGIAFLSFIFVPILAFGDAGYEGATPATA